MRLQNTILLYLDDIQEEFKSEYIGKIRQLFPKCIVRNEGIEAQSPLLEIENLQLETNIAIDSQKEHPIKWVGKAIDLYSCENKDDVILNFKDINSNKEKIVKVKRQYIKKAPQCSKTLENGKKCKKGTYFGRCYLHRDPIKNEELVKETSKLDLEKSK